MEQHPHLDPCDDCSVGHRLPDEATPLSHGEDYVRYVARKAGIMSGDVDGEVLRANEVMCEGKDRLCPRLSAFLAAVRQTRVQREGQARQA